MIDVSKVENNIPSLPDVVNDIILSLNDENANIESLTNKIMMDPALATRILKIANSPFYGLSGKISSLKEACIVLGAYSIKNLAVAVGVVNKMNKSGKAINTTKLWEHSVGTGAAARVIAEKLGLDHEIAFTSGLLHDVGKMILDANYPVEYKKVMDFKVSEDCYLVDAEKEILGVTHTEIGEVTAKFWKLPPVIIDVIRHHHHPGNGANKEMVGVVHLANIVCRSLEIGYPGDSLIPSIDAGVITGNLLDMDILGTLLPDIDSLGRASVGLILSS